MARQYEKSPSDEVLVSQLNDPKTRRSAFATIVRQYHEPLYWKVRRIVLDHDDANDIMQNVFLKAWTNLDDFRQQSKISTWLYRIAVNESLDFLRKQKTASSVRLPEVQRMVFNLRYFDEMKYSEMSKLLDTSEGALKASYHLAVKKITDYVRNHDE